MNKENLRQEQKLESQTTGKTETSITLPKLKDEQLTAMQGGSEIWNE